MFHTIASLTVGPTHGSTVNYSNERFVHQFARVLDVLTAIALIVLGCYAVPVGLTPAAGLIMIGVGSGLAAWIVANMATHMKHKCAAYAYLYPRHHATLDSN